MEALLNADALIALVTLTVLEVVLGVDNVIFISILAGKLPAEQQDRARRVGLLAAMGMRIALLSSLAWIVRLTAPLFTLLGQEISGRDLILLGGGLFLLWKSTTEIHHKLEGEEEGPHGGRAPTSFSSTILQIMLLDLVFSLDSVITAVGMADHVEVMIAAVVVAVIVMMFLAGPIGDFVDRHPTIKMLALSFLILIGTALVGEGLDLHIPKGYIYFAMAFSVAVEMLNIRVRKRLEPVKLRKKLEEE